MYGSVSRWIAKEGLIERDLSNGITLPKLEQREVYTSNSASPETTANFQRLRGLMESDPEWHDGEVIVSR